MSPPAGFSTTTTTTTTNTTTSTLHRSIRAPSTTTFLLLTLLILSAFLFSPATSISFLDTLKNQRNPPTDCQTDMDVSAICYQCASLDPSRFYDIHDLCCEVDGRVRQLCRAWYTEEPKRGRRDVWYY